MNLNLIIKSGILLILMFFMRGIQPSYAQVIINEVCSYNGDIIEDEDGEKPDWFELYNSGSFPVLLTGYAVAESNNLKWFFPDTVIASHQYLLVFASGKNKTESALHTSFKISKGGDRLSLYDASGVMIDAIQIESLQLDHSAGRYPDGNTTQWSIFCSPTPGASNNNSVPFSGYTVNPVFTMSGGFYTGNTSLGFSVSQPATIIRYTLDGRIPTDTSAIFLSHFNLTATTVVRARAFSSDGNLLPSEVITNTYIINYLSELPVISISTNPENLWDWNTGIYVLGPNADSVYPYHGANFWQDWEIPAHIEFFETNHNLAFEQDAGLSINGGSVSRTRPQQSFRVTARDKYGKAEIEHRIFQQKPINKFKIIVLRNSSGDFNKTHFRDGSLHKLMIGHANIDLLCYRPSAIFLNGEYWGILNIREKFGKYYLKENYHIDPDNVDILEEDSTVIQGDFDAFHAMHDFITGNEMSVKANYDSAVAMIDIESFCDYFIAETYLSNIDWPYNNIKYWRERSVEKKWRYMLMDLDISLGNNGWAPANLDFLGKILGPYGDGNKHVQLFRSLLKNEGLKKYFINRYADLVNTLFSTKSLMKNTQEVMGVLAPEMPKHFNRWGNDMGGWYHEINQCVIPYINDRPTYALQFVCDTFHLKKEVDVMLDVWPPAGGRIHINTIEPESLPWKGIYFDGVPITITAVANPGFRFVQWQSDNIQSVNTMQPSLTLNVDTNNRFTAFFISSDHAHDICVFPNPANTNLNVGFILDKAEKGILTLCNSLGKVVKSVDANFMSGSNLFSFEISGLAGGVYFIHLNTSRTMLSTKVLIVH